MDMKKNRWGTICWQKVEVQLFKRQQKIYQARISKNRTRVCYLQSQLLRSRNAKTISIRNIDNQTKKSQKFIYFTDPS